MSNLIFPIITLTVLSVLGVLVAIFVARRLGRWLNFRTMLIVNVVLVDVASGVAHLAHVDGVSRGYFDLLTSSDAPSLTHAIAGGGVALLSVCISSLHGLPAGAEIEVETHPGGRTTWVLPSERTFLFWFTILLLPLAISGSLKVRTYAAQLDQERIISLSQGLARYSYFSNWLVWVVCFAALWLASSKFASRSGAVTLLIAASAVVVIAASLAWNGGRSIVLVMTLPIAMVLLPRMRGTRLLALPVGLATLLTYTTSVSQRRSAGQYDQTSIVSWLDWQWGRFSMIGFAEDYVATQGHMWGETLLAGVTTVLFGILNLVGIHMASPDLTTSTEVTGGALLHDERMTYIVPGMASELYLNFGLVGIAIGFYLLGRVTNWVDFRFTDAPSAVSQLFWAYLGTLLVFRTVAADSGALWAYLVFSGTPLLMALVYSRRAQRLAAARLAKTRQLEHRN